MDGHLGRCRPRKPLFCGRHYLLGRNIVPQFEKNIGHDDHSDAVIMQQQHCVHSPSSTAAAASQRRRRVVAKVCRRYLKGSSRSSSGRRWEGVGDRISSLHGGFECSANSRINCKFIESTERFPLNSPLKSHGRP